MFVLSEKRSAVIKLSAVDLVEAKWPALTKPIQGAPTRRLLLGRQDTFLCGRHDPRHSLTVARNDEFPARLDLPDQPCESLVGIAQGDFRAHSRLHLVL